MGYPTNDMLSNTALGAFWQGQGIGETQRKSYQDAEAASLAQLMKELTAGNDLSKSNLEGARAQQMNTPDMLDWYSKGYAGQMKSQDASGRKAQDLYADDLAYSKQKLQNDLAQGRIDAKEYAYRTQKIDAALAGQSQQPQGTIGFNMQQPEPQSNFNENYGNEGRGLTPLPILKTEAAMKNSMGTDYRSGSKPYDLETIDKEIKQFGDKTGELAKERARIQQELAAGGGGEQPQGNVFSSFATKTQQPTENRWLQGINPNDPVMAAFMDTPKFRQELAKGEQKTDSAEEIAARRAEAAAQQAKKDLADPKYNEQLAAAFKTTANPNSTPQQKYEADMFIYMDRQRRLASNPSAYKQSIDIGALGGVPMVTPPVQQAQVPPQPGGAAPQNLQKQVEASGIKYEPTMYDYRVVDGKVQRKKKE